jgi:hypothetical protein
MLDSYGRVVPGSEREGHNVLTNTGREYLSQMIAWDTIAATDIPYTNHRVRWMGVGSGSQPETPSVITLQSPVEITSGVYLQAIEDPPTFPTVVSVKYTALFGTGDISFSTDILVRELALYVDQSPPVDLNPAIGTNPAIAYKVLDEGFVKMDSFTLQVDWEFSF